MIVRSTTQEQASTNTPKYPRVWRIFSRSRTDDVFIWTKSFVRVENQRKVWVMYSSSHLQNVGTLVEEFNQGPFWEGSKLLEFEES